MASLVEDGAGNYLIAFRWAGRQYTRSADTRDASIAEASRLRVEEAIRLTKAGWLTMPADAEPGIFLMSGGKLAKKPAPAPAPHAAPAGSLGGLFDRYLADMPEGHKESTTRGTERTHIAHLRRLMGDGMAAEGIALASVQAYYNARAAEVWRGVPIKAQTIRKELETFRLVIRWGKKFGHLAAEPSWQLGDLAFAKGAAEREPFRTFDEIRARIRRGKIPEDKQAALWECLYLRGHEVASALDYVAEHAIAPFVTPMFTFVALTGARRSELCRSLIDDWDFDAGVVHLRERKRDSTKLETMRSVEIHPRLDATMRAWIDAHPGGMYALCQTDGSPITIDEATDHFKRTLRGSPWEPIAGFHTFRHSFASILASNGVDQRVIDSMMGHQTEEMRRRYRHLFPANRRRAIDGLLG